MRVLRGEAARTRPRDLAARLTALREAVAVADGRLDPHVVAEARRVIEQADTRLALAPGCTTVALAGATGSGKSSLFNALAGLDLSPVGRRRPTTGAAHACVWGDGAAAGLLDWLEVPARHRMSGSGPTHVRSTGPDEVTGADFDGLVLLDLPDHDSTEVSHRLEVDRLVERVDLMVWVLDPQKYADGLVHEHYLRHLARHEPVLLVVLNQVDLLSADDRARCLADLARLLRDDGLANVAIVATSAVTGEGLPQLRDILAARVAARRAAAERLAADVDGSAERLRSVAGGSGLRVDASAELPPAARERLTDALADAAGVPAVTSAVAAAYRGRAVQAAGWPPARWLRRLRPDPLRRLHLGLSGGGGDERIRTSLPPPGPGARAVAEAAVRDAAAALVLGLPPPWPARARAAAVAQAAELPDRLDRAVAGTDLGMAPPAWWRLVGLTQWVVTLAAVVGAVWLVALAAVGWLRLPAPDPPRVGVFPLPTVLLLGGVLAGWLLALLARRLAAWGARRRARRAAGRLRTAIATVAEGALQPVLAERRAYTDIHAALDRAAG